MNPAFTCHFFIPRIPYTMEYIEPIDYEEAIRRHAATMVDRYFLQFRYDLPDEGRFSEPYAPLEWLLNAFQNMWYTGTWCYETKKKNGDPSKRHIHCHLAVDVPKDMGKSRFKNYDAFVTYFRNWITNPPAGVRKRDSDGVARELRARGLSSGWVWKPKCYSFIKVEDVQDHAKFFGYCLKMADPTNLEQNLVEPLFFHAWFPDLNLTALHELAKLLMEEAAEKQRKREEEQGRRTTLQLLLDLFADEEFLDYKQIYIKVLDYHMQEKLNVVDNQMIMYVKTIALHKKLLSPDAYFEMLMKKF